MTSRSRVQTAILGDDSVVVFNERTQRMLSLNRTAAYLWFRHAEVNRAELAADLAARTGMDLAGAERAIDDYIATWKAAGFIPSDDDSDVMAVPDLGPMTSETVAEPLPPTDKTGRAPASLASLSGQLSGLNFCIRYEPEEVRYLLEPALQHLLGAAGPPDLAIEVQRAETDWTVLGSDGASSNGLATNEVVPLVIYGLLDGVLRRRGNSIAFHASAVRRNGGCVLLPAPPGSGKSTLCAVLLSRGYEFITDDVILFDEVSLGVRGVPLPLNLKEGSWAPLAKAYPALQSSAVHLRPDHKLVRLLVPPAIAPADQSHIVTSIVFPQFRPLSTLALRPLDQSLALNRLVSEASSNSLRLSGAQFNNLARFLRPPTCWELDFASLDAAVDAIDQICRETPPLRES